MEILARPTRGSEIRASLSACPSLLGGLSVSQGRPNETCAPVGLPVHPETFRTKLLCWPRKTRCPLAGGARRHGRSRRGERDHVHVSGPGPCGRCVSRARLPRTVEIREQTDARQREIVSATPVGGCDVGYDVL